MLLEKETALRIADVEYENRRASLDLCRTRLFPDLGVIRAVRR